LLFRDTAESNIYTKQVWGLKGVYILKINKTSFKIVL
jgi:hypothetical protein